MPRIPLFALLIMPSIAFGALLVTKPGSKTIESVKLAEEATVMVGDKATPLGLYVSGLRKKKIAIFWADVYVAQIYSSPGLPTPKTIAEGAETLSAQPVLAVTLTFLRDVGTGKLISGFKDSLEKNDVDPKNPSIQALLTMVEKGGDAKEKSTTTIVFEKNKDGAESARFENMKNELQTATFEPGTMKKIVSMWFGKPSDSGIERLQKQFLGQTP